MRRLTRPALPPGLQKQLDRQTRRIVRLRTHAERYAASQANWKSAGKIKLRRALEAMNGGHDRCMYCEYSEAGTVDHFCPRAKDPKQTFHWRNLLRACGPCQNAKNDAFPRGLLNPARKTYVPWDHLQFEPKTGEYVLLSAEAKASGPVYRWGRGRLPRYRRRSFKVFQAAILAYSIARQAGNATLAEDQVETVREEPHPGVFDWILYWCDMGPPSNPALDPLDPRVRQAVAAYPEIRTWLT